MKHQYCLEDFNPDAMPVDEMHDWVAFIGNGQRPQVAKQWFPGVKGQYAFTRAIRNYLHNKITAANCRLEGNVNEALMYEAICDRIYSELPESAKW